MYLCKLSRLTPAARAIIAAESSDSPFSPRSADEMCW
jgi:hypothetical protein